MDRELIQGPDHRVWIAERLVCHAPCVVFEGLGCCREVSEVGGERVGYSYTVKLFGYLRYSFDLVSPVATSVAERRPASLPGYSLST